MASPRGIARPSAHAAANTSCIGEEMARSGSFRCITPTGKSVAAQQSHWFRVADGKLAEHWAVRDDLSMMQQLGVRRA